MELLHPMPLARMVAPPSPAPQLKPPPTYIYVFLKFTIFSHPALLCHPPNLSHLPNKLIFSLKPLASLKTSQSICQTHIQLCWQSTSRQEWPPLLLIKFIKINKKLNFKRKCHQTLLLIKVSNPWNPSKCEFVLFNFPPQYEKYGVKFIG